MILVGERERQAQAVIDARRSLVAELAEQGHSNRAIAKEVGTDEATIRRDLKFLRTPADQRPASKRRRRRALTYDELLKQMLTVVKRWIVSEALGRFDVFELLNAAGKGLYLNPLTRYTGQETSLKPAELLPLTRPDDYNGDYGSDKLESCIRWLMAWLTACTPREKLRDEVLTKTEQWAERTLS